MKGVKKKSCVWISVKGSMDRLDSGPISGILTVTKGHCYIKMMHFFLCA